MYVAYSRLPQSFLVDAEIPLVILGFLKYITSLSFNTLKLPFNTLYAIRNSSSVGLMFLSLLKLENCPFWKITSLTLSGNRLDCTLLSTTSATATLPLYA